MWLWYCSFFLISTPLAISGGFHISVHDAEGTARGNAVGATIDRPSSIYYNPAGLCRITDITVSTGAYVASIENEARISNGRFSTDTGIQLVPHLFLAYPIADRLTAGFSVTVPFGLSSTWKDEPLTYFATENAINDLVYSFALGYEVNDNFKIGGTIDIHDLTLELGQQPPLVSPSLPAPILTNIEAEINDIALGFSIGLQYSLTEHHHFGLVYRHAPQFDLEGRQTDINAAFAGVAATESIYINNLNLPDTASLSYSFTPNKKWDFGVSIEWINWDELDAYTTQGGSNDLPVIFNWKTSFMYEIGITYVTDNNWKFSAGYVYNENSQPDNINYNPAASDTDRHWLSCGLGRSYKHLSWFMAYQYGFSQNTIKNSNAFLNGKYDTVAHSLMTTLTYKF